MKTKGVVRIHAVLFQQNRFIRSKIRKGGRKMSSSKLFMVFISLACVFFFASFASGASIAPNHVKEFKGGEGLSKLLIVHLSAPERTDLHIEVTNGDKIVEYHRLVVGPKGVCEGQFKGAHSWEYVLPSGTQGEDLNVNVLVRPIAGIGAPIPFVSREYSKGDPQGFIF
jgi:hypothetical protein